MQYLLALLRPKLPLVATVLIALGIGLIVFQPLPSASQAPALPPEPSALLDDPELPPGSFGLPEDDAGLLQPTATPEPPASVIVYISGAVRAPDVYELPEAARVKDLVLAAGGLAEEADPDRINLAERLSDGQHVYVPRVGGPAHAPGAPAQGDAAGAATLLDLNTASAADLDGLAGIGPALAARIIEHRAANGPFRAVEELQEVRGIGPALIAQIAPLITVGP